MPTKILFGNSNYITYLYTASGQKMEKIVYENNDRTTTDYINGFQYKTLSSGDGGLVFFPHAEGYVKHTAGAFNYVFNYTDHLGNVRMSYGKDPVSGVLKITEENNYYAFGMKHKNYNMSLRGYGKLNGNISLNTCENCVSSYNYKFAKKELQDKLGLNVYSFGWRDYDPAIGRFLKMDRFSEKYHRYTPYGYAGNNPVLVNDIQGDSLWISHKRNNYLYEYDKKNGGQLYTVSKGQKTAYSGKVNGFLGKSFDALNNLNKGSSTANGILGDVQSSNLNVTISHSSNNPNGNRNEFNDDNKSNSYAFARLLTGQGSSSVTNIGSGGTVYWDPSGGSVWELNNSNQGTNTTTNLFHELVHGWDSINGDLDNRDNGSGLSIMESRAVYYENKTRMDMGANKREYYKSTYDVNGSLVPYPPRTLDSSNNPIFTAPPSIYFLMK